MTARGAVFLVWDQFGPQRDTAQVSRILPTKKLVDELICLLTEVPCCLFFNKLNNSYLDTYGDGWMCSLVDVLTVHLSQLIRCDILALEILLVITNMPIYRKGANLDYAD